MNTSILSLWPCCAQRLALSLLSDRYRGGIRLTGAGKAVSSSPPFSPSFFFSRRDRASSTRYHPCSPFWPGSPCFVCFFIEPSLVYTERAWNDSCATSLICTEGKREEEGDAANRLGRGPKWGGAHWDVGGESGRPSDPSTHGAVCSSSWGEGGARRGGTKKQQPPIILCWY